MKLQSPLLVGLVLLSGLMLSNQNGQPGGQLAALERAASPQWPVSMSLNPATVTVGSLDLAMTVRSARGGYLTLLQRGTDGKEDILFPNALDPNNRIEADQPFTLPRAHWKLSATPPAGEGRLLAVVTERPLDPQTLQASSQIYGAASAVYRERE